MDNPHFDGTLREIESRTELPFDEAQWGLMARRLDLYEKGQKAVPFPMRISYGTRWAAAAAVLLMALAGAWLLNRDSEKGEAGQAIAVTAPGTAQPSPAEKNIQSGQATETAATVSPKVPPRANRDRIYSSPFVQTIRNPSRLPAPQIQSFQPPLAAFPQSEETRPEERQRGDLPEQQPVVIRRDGPRQPTPCIEDPFSDEPVLASADKTVFDISGGYGGGSGAKNSFALGVAVKRNLSSRLKVEAGVGVVSGEYDTYNTITVATTPPGMSGSLFDPAAATATTTQSQEATERIAYLQGSPSLSYRIAGGLALGGGVDAQRRISGAASKSNEDYYQLSAESYAREEAGPQPEWDFGLTARADYTLSQRLSLGVMYRESVGTTSTTGKRAAGRNYMLVQLGFRLF